MGYPLIVDYGSEGNRVISITKYYMDYYLPLDENYQVAPYIKTSRVLSGMKFPVIFCKQCRYIVKVPYITPFVWREKELQANVYLPARYSQEKVVGGLPSTFTPDMHGKLFVSRDSWKDDTYIYDYSHIVYSYLVLDRQQLFKGLNYFLLFTLYYYGNDSHSYPRMWWYFTNEDRSKYVGYYWYTNYYGDEYRYVKIQYNDISKSIGISNSKQSGYYATLKDGNIYVTGLEQNRIVWSLARAGYINDKSMWKPKILTHDEEVIRLALSDLDEFRYLWIAMPYFSNSASTKEHTIKYDAFYYIPYNEPVTLHNIQTTSTNGTVPVYWEPIENETIDLTMTNIMEADNSALKIYGNPAIPLTITSGGYATPARAEYIATSDKDYRYIKIDKNEKTMLAYTQSANTPPYTPNISTTSTIRYVESQINEKDMYLPKALAISNNKYPVFIRGNKVKELLEHGLKATNITATDAGDYIYILPITSTEEGIYVPIDANGNIQPFKRIYADDKIILVVKADSAFTIYYKSDSTISAMEADFDYDIPMTHDLTSVLNASTDSENVFYYGSKVGHMLISNKASSYIVGYDTQDYTMIAVVKSGRNISFNQLDVTLTEVNGAGDAYIPNTFDESFNTNDNTFVIVTNAIYDSDNSNWNANLYIVDNSLITHNKTMSNNVGTIIQATSTDIQNTHYLIFTSFYMLSGKYDVIFKTEQDIVYNDNSIVVATPPAYKSLKGLSTQYKTATTGTLYISDEGVPVFVKNNKIVPSFGLYNSAIKMGYSLDATHVGLSEKHLVDARQLNLFVKDGTTYALPFSGVYAILMKLQGNANITLYSADYDLRQISLTATSTTIHLIDDMPLNNGYALLIYDTNTGNIWITNGNDIQNDVANDMVSNGSTVLKISEIDADALADIQIVYIPTSINNIEKISYADLTDTINIGDNNNTQVNAKLQIVQQNSTDITSVIQVGTENNTQVQSIINITDAADTVLDTVLKSYIQSNTFFDGIIHTYNYANTTLDSLIRTYGQTLTTFDTHISSFINTQTSFDVQAKTYQSLYTYFDTKLVVNFFNDKYFDTHILTRHENEIKFDTYIIAGIVVDYTIDNQDNVYNLITSNIDNTDSIFNNVTYTIDNSDSIFNNVESTVDTIDDIEAFGYGEDLPYYRVEIPNPTIVLHILSTQVVKYRILFNNLPITQLRQGYELNVYMQDLRTGNKYYDWIEIKNRRLHITPRLSGDFLLIFSIKWALNDKTYETIIGKKAVHVYGKLPQNNWGF